MNIVKLFGLDIYSGSPNPLLEEIIRRPGKTHIISGNAEVLKLPLKDGGAYRLFQGAENIIIPDGISVFYPIKKKDKNCGKIPGIDFMRLLLQKYQCDGKSVYFLGARQEVIDAMIPAVKISYPQLKIAGFHHGYFDKDNSLEIIADIKQSGAHALFVALGTPAQENFIFRYMNELPCSLFMGVGGSFDVLSGHIKRSPQWVSDMGFEWLYRLVKDPSKIGRMWNNITFTLKALLWG
jgi:N-acetylglucosaminyldiphosphoundecaprenol N-acetyl-beta-D-mannosaminyltransferase